MQLELLFEQRGPPFDQILVERLDMEAVGIQPFPEARAAVPARAGGHRTRNSSRVPSQDATPGDRPLQLEAGGVDRSISRGGFATCALVPRSRARGVGRLIRQRTAISSVSPNRFRDEREVRRPSRLTGAAEASTRGARVNGRPVIIAIVTIEIATLAFHEYRVFAGIRHFDGRALGDALVILRAGVHGDAALRVVPPVCAPQTVLEAPPIATKTWLVTGSAATEWEDAAGGLGLLAVIHAYGPPAGRAHRPRRVARVAAAADDRARKYWPSPGLYHTMSGPDSLAIALMMRPFRWSMTIEFVECVDPLQPTMT